MQNKFNSESIIAILRLVVTLIVSVLSAIGIAVDISSVYTIIACIASVAMIAYSWHKNSNITQAAQDAQKVLDALKSGKDVAIEINEIVKEKPTDGGEV
ncbi:MAG: hypothetical protein HUJ63_06735 [Enterococcus sp.]|nr:hypothetical protein [Enterococcus sp.]